MVVVETDLLEVADVGENAIVIVAEGLKRGRLGGFGGSHAGWRARGGTRGERVGGGGGVVNHHPRMPRVSRFLRTGYSEERGRRAAAIVWPLF